MNQLTTLSGVLILATLVEALVEFLVKPLAALRPLMGLPAVAEPAGAGENPPDAVPELLIRYSSAALGILLCIAYHADLLLLADLAAPLPWIGYVITGVLIGRGANFVHDFASRLLVRQP